jgi:single-strand DNA-binding protein
MLDGASGGRGQGAGAGAGEGGYDEGYGAGGYGETPRAASGPAGGGSRGRSNADLDDEIPF